MKFRRIDEDTIRCIVSKEDMQEYGIVLEDFFKNKGKVHEFLHEIVERAEQEVGYEPKEGLLSMQIIPISQNMISITFSEQSSNDYEEMMNHFKNSVGDLLDESNLIPQPIDMDDISEEDMEDEVELPDTQDEPIKGMDNSTTVMIAMSSLEKMAEFCRILNINRTVKSELYRLENKDLYCLIIDKDRMSAGIMKHILLLAVEYTSNITDELKIISYVREHGEIIIEKSAYRILKKYV